MKTLLVYPEFPDTYWSFRHALSFEGKRSAFPPLGLLTISAMLPDAWERRLVDMNIQRLKPSDIEWADVVFCSAMLVQKDSLRRVVELCKVAGKRVVIVTGGWRVSGCNMPSTAPESSPQSPAPASDVQRVAEFVPPRGRAISGERESLSAIAWRTSCSPRFAAPCQAVFFLSLRRNTLFVSSRKARHAVASHGMPEKRKVDPHSEGCR